MHYSRSAPGTRAVWVLVVAPSVLVAVAMASLYLVVMPLVPVLHEYYFAQQALTYATYQAPLLTHIIAASIALILGPINLATALRRRRPRAHRIVGRLYAVAVAVAAVAAMFMAFHAYPGTIPGGRVIVTTGFCAMAVAWLGTLMLAVRAIAVSHDRARHRFWMTINISITFVAVVLRLENGVILATGTFDALYPLLPWTSLLPNLAVGTWLARKAHQKNGTQPGTAGPLLVGVGHSATN